MKKISWRLLPPLSWLAFITILFFTPGTKFPKINWQDKILLDKWIHLFLFLVLVVLWCRAYFFRNDNQPLRKIYIIITILSIIYGVAVEIVQLFFIPFRSFDAGDIGADSIGALLGYLVAIRRYTKPMAENSQSNSHADTGKGA